MKNLTLVKKFESVMEFLKIQNTLSNQNIKSI